VTQANKKSVILSVANNLMLTSLVFDPGQLSLAIRE